MKEFLKDNPDLVLFACLALGYAVGKIPIWKIRLGGVCGTLLVALVIGQSGVVLDPEVKSLAFALFIFTLGYIGGPQFFANLNRKGLRYAVFPAVEVVSVLAVALAATAILDLDQGTAAGLLAGGATESAVVGTATDAIGKLGLDPATTQTLQANVATAYTISYVVGLITIVLLTSQIIPAIMRVNLRDEADKLWRKLGGTGGDGEAPALPEMVGRLHRVSYADGATVSHVEERLGTGAAVEQVRRGDANLPIAPNLRLETGDAVLLVGRRSAVLTADTVIGPEQAGADGIDLQLDSRDVVVGRGQYNNKTLAELRREIPSGEHHKVFLSSISRQETPLPVRDGTVIQSGDVLRLTGPKKDVGSLAGKLGYLIDPSVKLDFIYIGVGIILGILIGKLTLRLGDVPLSLGTGGGCLLSGLVLGWLRSKHPTFGAYHPAAASVIKDFGLAAFIAAVGLSSGPQAVKLVQQYGISLPIAGLCMTLIPASISFFIAWKLMKMEAPLLLGCVAGQQCSTPAITAVQGVAGNSTPLLSYTIVYALSNVILPLLGPIIVALSGQVA
ncbi:aspartate-alanine antiporter [Longispora albida]|uniref:aspartate-alanine antiporter n=1 Tax=Longispora albida TaxID=203523 RepID=UPI000367509F|nr:aspartate-alanine antiporter [Longispora albida]